jgi:hypothetical protein
MNFNIFNLISSVSIGALLVIFANPVFADDHQHVVSGALGFMAPGENQMSGTQSNGNPGAATFHLAGLFGIGGDYDYMKNKDMSFGGFLRYYSTSSSYNNTSYKNTMLAFGPDVKAYFSNDVWLGYVGAGIDYLAPTYSANGNSLSIDGGLGLMMSIGILYKVSDTIGVGLETMRLIGLSSSINGSPTEDFMFKARFQL